MESNSQQHQKLLKKFKDSELVVLDLHIDKETWKTILPKSVVYAGREYYVLKPGLWTDVMFSYIRKADIGSKINCHFAFTKNQVMKEKNMPWLNIYGYCPECKNQFFGYCVEKPDLNFVEDVVITVITRNTSNIQHSKERNLAGESRKRYKKMLSHEPVKKFKDKLAGKLLSDSGRQQDEELHKTYIYQKCRQEARDEKINLHLYPGNPIQSVISISKSDE